MMHPHTELRLVSAVIGSGVFATAPIPKGTLTWVRDPLDQRIEFESDDFPSGLLNMEVVRRYLYTDRQGRVILLWDHGRFVNHSCSPNTAGGLNNDFSVALRDIAAGEEITEDYGELMGFDGFDCHCGHSDCRRFVESLEQTQVFPREQAVRAALKAGRELNQPLGEVRTFLSKMETVGNKERSAARRSSR
jgi:hypothetical protein